MNKINIEKIIKQSFESDNHVICEDMAKNILKSFGIPVVKEKRVENADQAVQAASTFGFPVVLKGIGSNLMHKTESGIVKLGLWDQDQVKEAALYIQKQAGKDLEGLLVQPQITGKREFVAGMFKDPQFGPVIMFGVGGIYTEALKDTSFKIAPLKENDIDAMLDEIASKKLLQDFRGEKAVNKAAIKKILMGLSDFAMAHDQIKEIDINPLVIKPDGNPVAVDALIITSKEKQQPKQKPEIDKTALRSCFYPESIVFVGASSNIGKWGHMLVTNLLSQDYKGDVYLVNPKTKIIAEKKVYSTLEDIENDIDLAVVTIPADKVIDLIPQLKKKNVKGILLISSGFKETGMQGQALEQELVKEAQKAGILILGPNTMGICNPHINFFCSGVHVYPLPGSTALVCQSGNMGTQLMAFAEQQDIGIRAFSGSGNEAMVTIEDYMETFEVDELTRTVVLYLESIKDGNRFFKSAARVSKKKPVVVLKGGRTSKGSIAASSHTGALASDSKVFQAACRQSGIIQVDQPMELLDLSAVFSSLPLPKGNKVAIMTLGGGWGVITTDLCLEHGLEVPDLSKDIIKELDAVLPSFWSHGNPVDIVGENDPAIPVKTVEALLKWDECDAVIHLGIHGKRLLANKMIDSIEKADPIYSKEELSFFKDVTNQVEEDYIKEIIKLTQKYEKPVLGVSLLTDATTKTLYRVDNNKYKGVFFPSPERAVKALWGMCNYNKWLQQNK